MDLEWNVAHAENLRDQRVGIMLTIGRNQRIIKTRESLGENYFFHAEDRVSLPLLWIWKMLPDGKTEQPIFVKFGRQMCPKNTNKLRNAADEVLAI